MNCPHGEPSATLCDTCLESAETYQEIGFVCEICRAARFDHPEREGDDCPTVEGRCGHLMGAGWRPVSLRIATDPGNVGLCIRGGWVCPACAERYGANLRKPPKRRRVQ